MAKSYKALYEELKAQKNPVTEKELLALKAVAHGCNQNRFLRGCSYGNIRYERALEIVHQLIKRLSV
jgi:hypothetical protein